MKLKIAETIQEKYPDLKIGVVIARDITNRQSDSLLEQLKRKAEDKLRSGLI
ncbi:MAG: hypothetical protein AAB525_03745 [Patescibacteria group bacterium]